MMRNSLRFKQPIKQGTSGFTLLEVLVIILIVGVLTAIAAPGWLAFTNRQRLGRASDQVLQALRTAQSEAKRTGTYREVLFDTAADPPRFAVLPVQTNADGKADLRANTNAYNTLRNSGNWETIGEGNIRPGITGLTDNLSETLGDTQQTASIVFTPKGQVVDPGYTSQTDGSLFSLTMYLRDSNAVKRCVRVETLLGAVTQGEDRECPEIE